MYIFTSAKVNVSTLLISECMLIIILFYIVDSFKAEKKIVILFDCSTQWSNEKSITCFVFPISNTDITEPSVYFYFIS